MEKRDRYPRYMLPKQGRHTSASPLCSQKVPSKFRAPKMHFPPPSSSAAACTAKRRRGIFGSGIIIITKYLPFRPLQCCKIQEQEENIAMSWFFSDGHWLSYFVNGCSFALNRTRVLARGYEKKCGFSLQTPFAKSPFSVCQICALLSLFPRRERKVF